MKKRVLAVVMAFVFLAGCLSACNAAGTQADNAPAAEVKPSEAAPAAEETAPSEKAAEEAASEEEAAPKYETFKSNNGWSVEYDSNVIKCEDNTDPADEVSFTYTGKASGDNYLVISFAEGKLPPEQIQTCKDIQDSGTKTTVEGGIFPGTTDKWAYWIDFENPDDKSGNSESIILGEYKGGTLELDFRTHKAGDDEIDIPVSDALAMIVDSLKFDDFGPQTMYDGIPGIYTQTITEEMEGKEVVNHYEVQLADDHTGVLCLQDDIPVQWDDKMIRSEDGSFTYFYKIEGDKLIMDYDGIENIFARSDAEGRVNPPIIADMEKYDSVISTLQKGSYITFAEIYKDKESENDVLLVSKPNCVFDNTEGGMACTEADVYAFDKDGKIKKYGEAISGGTAIPLSVYEGCLYFGNHVELTRVYVDEEKSELVTEKDRPFDELDHVTELAFSTVEELSE